MITLFDDQGHRNFFFNDLSTGSMVQANQHVIQDGPDAIVLDPGGHKVHSRLLAALASALPRTALKHVFFSHQDPDILAAANAWLMMTDARGYLSSIWMRFIPHFGVDELVIGRIHPIPDQGMSLPLGQTTLKVLPAHFLHSPGNFQVYDPVSRILYSGDLGASLGNDYDVVEDFDAHVRYMEGFHRRYMPSQEAFRRWAHMVRGLEIDAIAPQHGAILKGRQMVARFVDWVESLPCGVEALATAYTIPD